MFDEVSQLVNMQNCGVRLDPMFQRVNPTDMYCMDVFHHLTWAELSEILFRLKDLFAGPAGTNFNDWSTVVERAGISLGRIYIMIGSGTGNAQVEVESIVKGIFKYP